MNRASLPLLLAAIILSGMPAVSRAENLGQEPVVFESGNWSVHRGADAMTDKVSCTGIYKNDFGIQLSPGNLFIHVSGGLEQVQLRLDDDGPTRARMPSEVEKKIGSVTISGVDFNNVLRAKRLRTNILTNVSGVHEDDLDLTGIDAAYNSISNGCPGDPIKAVSKATAPAVADGCSERAKVKLKIKGMSEAEIKEICAK